MKKSILFLISLTLFQTGMINSSSTINIKNIQWYFPEKTILWKRTIDVALTSVTAYVCHKILQNSEYRPCTVGNAGYNFCTTINSLYPILFSGICLRKMLQHTLTNSSSTNEQQIQPEPINTIPAPEALILPTPKSQSAQKDIHQKTGIIAMIVNHPYVAAISAMGITAVLHVLTHQPEEPISDTDSEFNDE